MGFSLDVMRTISGSKTLAPPPIVPPRRPPPVTAACCSACCARANSLKNGMAAAAPMEMRAICRRENPRSINDALSLDVSAIGQNLLVSYQPWRKMDLRLRVGGGDVRRQAEGNANPEPPKRSGRTQSGL